MQPLHKQTKASHRTLWIGPVVVVVILGVAYEMRISAQKRDTFTNDGSISAGANIGAVPPATQTIAEQTVRDFLADLQHQNYTQALNATASDFPTPHSAAALKILTQKKSFAMIFTCPLKFDPATIGSHGQKMIMRASLQGDAKPYRTVCTFSKKNGTWLISNILDPIPPSQPPTVATPGGVKSHG